MTNHWNDIDNASMVFVFGANPAENHPACMAHVNAARDAGAKLVVVDPRLTRTAKQCDPDKGDMFVRIRPGTNIAFINGVLNWIFNNVADYKPTAAANMLAWHNGTATNSLSAARTFIDDAGATKTFDAGNLATAKYDGVAAPELTAGYPKYCDTRFKINAAGTDYQRKVLTVGTNTDYLTDANFRFTNFPVIASSVSDEDCVYQKLKAHTAKYDLATTADICGCNQFDIANVGKAIIDHSRFSSSDFGLGTSTPRQAGYKATTILYAMGQTQHTSGSQNIKGLAVLQTLLGNMGRAGGGINALRGIHNVQGSTDMGLLFDSIPAYSGNPGTATTYQAYLNPLFGNRVAGTTTKVYTNPADLGLQQRGFHNMTTEFFGKGTSTGVDVEKLYNLWPKGNGVQHIQTFRNMDLADGHADRIISAVVWGQNPAVTEGNQTKVRAGLKNLDMLVVVDVYATETAMVDRKDTGVTYLIPSCSYVEEAGSVTNSGRWLQWRERATLPKGNSKADMELMLRFAYSLDKAGAFSHMTDVAYNGAVDAVPTAGVWSTLDTKIVGPAYKALYGDKYLYTPAGAGTFEAVSLASVDMWRAGVAAPATETVTGSEAVCELIFREMCRPLNATATSGGTMWIYSGSDAGATIGVGGYNEGANWNGNVMPAVTNSLGTTTWQVKNRAKSRNNIITGNESNSALNYPRWGWAWLLNRRVFYNNGEVAGDQSDTFVSPGLVSCLFTINTNKSADWSLVYRAYKSFADRPNVVSPGHAAFNAASPHFLATNYSLTGRFPGHTEPYESPRTPAFQALWGRNTMSSGGASPTDDLVLAGTNIGAVADYPLVLTSIRCVEHFQGGPTTRNNSFNVEAEPVPWVEINSADARKYGIKDGDWVEVETARGGSTTSQEALTPNATAGWARGFKARVGVGLTANQRVAEGVVAIPWHWGDQGLGTGSRANDLCIDAFDANTTITEYKACLCKIKVVGS